MDTGAPGAEPWRAALLALAAKRLAPGRRLAFWQPSPLSRAGDLADALARELPPALRVVASATQALGGGRARTLLAVEKEGGESL